VRDRSHFGNGQLRIYPLPAADNVYRRALRITLRWQRGAYQLNSGVPEECPEKRASDVRSILCWRCNLYPRNRSGCHQERDPRGHRKFQGSPRECNFHRRRFHCSPKWRHCHRELPPGDACHGKRQASNANISKYWDIHEAQRQMAGRCLASNTNGGQAVTMSNGIDISTVRRSEWVRILDC